MHNLGMQLNAASKKVILFGVIIVSLSILSSVAFAANGIVLQLKDVPLRVAISLITSQSGANIVVADDSKMENKITANLNGVSLENALSYILGTADIAYKKTDDGTYLIGGSAAKEPVINPLTFGDALPLVQDTAVQRMKTDVAVISLVHSRPSEILRVIGWNGADAITENSTFPNRIKNRTNLPINNPFVNEQVIPTMDPSPLNMGAGRTGTIVDGAQQFGGGNRGNTGRQTQFGAGAGIPGAGNIGGGVGAGGQASGSMIPEGIDLTSPDIKTSHPAAAASGYKNPAPPAPIATFDTILLPSPHIFTHSIPSKFLTCSLKSESFIGSASIPTLPSPLGVISFLSS